MAEYFKEEAKTWDTKDRIGLAANIWKCMSANMVFGKHIKAADIGAGTGLLSMELAKVTAHVTALDSSKEMLDVLEGKIRENGIENISTQVIDINEELPLSGFGVIVSSMSLHHMKDTQAVFRKAYEALAPGGMLGIADLDKEDGGFHKDPAKMGVKHSGFEHEELHKAAGSAGFHDIKFHTAAVVTRARQDGSISEYRIFLMTAKKP